MVLPLRGPGAAFGQQAGLGLVRWAEESGARLTIIDCGDDTRRAAREARRLAPAVDLFFGPYGSGLTRAVVDELADTPWVIWNHGGAEVPERRARVVDVIGPASRYWDGLADVLREDGVSRERVLIAAGASPFSTSVCASAVASLARASATPLEVIAFDERTAEQIPELARTLGAAAIVGCGRPGEDLALGRALVGSDLWVGLVVCGVRAAKATLGEAIAGWVGPAQWLADAAGSSPLPASSDYPAAQAYAAATLARRALDLAGARGPDALWDAARAMRGESIIGAFAVDDQGRQVAHRPLLVRWEGEPCERRVAWLSREAPAGP